MKVATMPTLPTPANDTDEAVRVSFLGLGFQPMMASEVSTRLDETASVNKPFSYVVTPNVDHVVRLESEPALRQLYERAELILNDSRILEVLAGRDGHHFPASPGADIVESLFRHKIDPEETIVIIGCEANDVLAITEQFGLKDVRWHDAPMGLRKNPEAVAACAAFMAANPARFHFLCVGSPQQEMVAWAAAERGDVVGIGLCCGASIDFLSGKTNRAPGWMRRARLEWFYRLVSEPRRMGKRYLIDGPKIFSIWRKYRRENT